jgi:hypothetical protein
VGFQRDILPNAAYPIRKLGKVSRFKDPILKQVDQKCVHIGSHRLFRVECEGIGIPLIRV